MDKKLNEKSPTYRLGGWFWETGFNKDPIKDVEWMRDQNLRAMYGAWDALKNVDKQYPNHRLRVGGVHRRQAGIAAADGRCGVDRPTISAK